MSVVLYRQGATHKINGVKCEMGVFNEYLYQDLLSKGWFYTPEECYAEKKEPEKEDGNLTLDEMGDYNIRERAKDLGIPHWHNKNIDRLKKEVDEWQPED